jgi:hypothetical protein
MVDNATDDLMKVCFELDSEDWHLCPAENLWAEKVSEPPPRVILRNIPFHAEGVSFLDTVFVRMVRVEGGVFFRFDGVAARGGHSTYMILTPMECPEFPRYWGQLHELGCRYESGDLHTSYGHKMLYAVDVPPETDIDAVKALLDQGEADGVWIFQEGNIEHRPRQEMAHEQSA